LPWVLAATFLGLRVPLVFLLRETPRGGDQVHHVRLGLLPVFKEALQAYELRWLVCTWCLINAFASSMLWIYQPYLAAVQVDLVWNGAVFAGLSIVAALSSWSSPRLLRRFNAVVIFNVLGLLVAGSLFVMGIAITFWGVVCFSAHQVVRGLGRVVLQHELQKETPSSHRASVTSCVELLTRFSYSLVLLPLGAVTDWWGLNVALIGSGVLLLVGLSVSWVVVPRRG
jgi:hypothetical protein